MSLPARRVRHTVSERTNTETTNKRRLKYCVVRVRTPWMASIELSVCSWFSLYQNDEQTTTTAAVQTARHK